MHSVIMFDFAPVSVKITKQYPPTAKLLINLCAIVGGVFVVFGMINNTFRNVKRWVLES